MLKCFELSQTDPHKQAVTVNALSGHDWVLTLPIPGQVLFGLVASVFNALPRFSRQPIALCNIAEATAGSDHKPFISPIIGVYDWCQVNLR